MSMRPFLDIFGLVGLGEGDVAEFPLHILAPGLPCYDAYYHARGGPKYCGGDDYVDIPLLLSDDEAAAEAAMKLVVTAAASRRIVLYETLTGLKGDFLARMDVAMKRNAGGNTASSHRGRVTDLFVAEDVGTTFRVLAQGVRFRPIPRPVWNQVEDYYDSLGGNRHERTTNLAIGVDNTLTDSFVRPVRGVLSGLGILDTRRVIVGCF